MTIFSAQVYQPADSAFVVLYRCGVTKEGGKSRSGTAETLIARRDFCLAAAALIAGFGVQRALPYVHPQEQDSGLNIAAIDRARILSAAHAYLREAPITVTASASPRSAGGKHDYFSEGDYWWPDPNHPDGPYIQRDGMSNPDNFNDHRRALMRLSVQVPALTAAWMITGDERYGSHAAHHLRAWFVEPATRMNPNLQYAQAIHGRFTGRGTGIIDTVHLVEVARAISALERSPALPKTESVQIRRWFAEYLRWMTTSPNGQQERDAKNNHGTCWVMQVAEFARYAGNQELTAYCHERFKTVLVNQIAGDGSFPQELRRTKPYGYSLFNLDAMATVCQVLSTRENDLWSYELPDGRGMKKAMAYMFPFLANKKSWPLPPDVMYFDGWPVRHCSLVFAGLALSRPEYIRLWRTLNPDPTVEEIIRNYPIRQPVLWLNAGLRPNGSGNRGTGRQSS